MTWAQQKQCSLNWFFWLGAFCCSERKLISRFGKERLNNIWQAQVPPRSVPPSLPQWEGNLAAPGEAVPTLTGVIHSVSGTRWISWGCVWIHRFHAKGTSSQATCKSTSNRRLMWPARNFQYYVRLLQEQACISRYCKSIYDVASQQLFTVWLCVHVCT